MRAPIRLALIALSTTPLALSTSTRAQGAPQPAPELRKLDVLVGTWKGSGKVSPAEGVPAMSWTSKTSTRWILNGHVLFEETVIDLGEGGPGPLAFRHYYAWDRENKRYVRYSTGNMGTITTARVHWSDDKTMVTGAQLIEDGASHVDHWVTRLDGGSSRFVGYRSTEASPFYEHVVGTAKRTSKEPTELEAVTEAFMPEMVHTGRMKPFARAAGTYELSGWMVMPGMPKFEVATTEHVEMQFGGSVVQFRSKSEPHPDFPGLYEGFGYFAWSDEERRFRAFFLNNYGDVGTMHVRWIGRNCVSTSTGIRHGMPTTQRGVMETNAEGHLVRVFNDTAIAGEAPKRTFSGKYEKKS